MPKIQHLNVKLRLRWLKGDEYEANVDTEVLDSCYKPGKIEVVNNPPGIVGLKDHVYILADFTHKGQQCSQVVRKVTQKIEPVHSTGKRFVTAFVRVNGKFAGFASKQFPKVKK